MAQVLRDAIARPLAAAIASLESIALDQIVTGDAFDPRTPAALVSAGLHRLAVPVAQGGLGASMVEAAEVLAALGAVDGSTALGFAMHVQVVGAASQSDSWPAPLLDRFYAAIVDDGALVNAASTEEGGGSPARGAIPGTTAVPDQGAGIGWRLTGEKTWTTWLPALRLALVSARIEEGQAAEDQLAGSGIAAPGDVAAGPPIVGVFLVDLESPGVTRLDAFESMGMRGSASGRLVLDAVQVPADALIVRRSVSVPDPRGPAPGAWFAMAVAATYLGVGEGARARVAQWALERRPGDGSTAVADIPSVQVRLGRLDADLRAARIVLFDVVRRWSLAADADARNAVLPDLALAKVIATNAAVDATDGALRIAGGPGYLAGPLERAARDARAGLINPPLDDIALAGFARALLKGLDRAKR